MASWVVLLRGQSEKSTVLEAVVESGEMSHGTGQGGVQSGWVGVLEVIQVEGNKHAC